MMMTPQPQPSSMVVVTNRPQHINTNAPPLTIMYTFFFFIFSFNMIWQWQPSHSHSQPFPIMTTQGLAQQWLWWWQWLPASASAYWCQLASTFLLQQSVKTMSIAKYLHVALWSLPNTNLQTTPNHCISSDLKECALSTSGIMDGTLKMSTFPLASHYVAVNTGSKFWKHQSPTFSTEGPYSDNH